MRDALFTGQFKDIEFKTMDKMVELIIKTSKYAGNKVSEYQRFISADDVEYTWDDVFFLICLQTIVGRNLTLIFTPNDGRRVKLGISDAIKRGLI